MQLDPLYFLLMIEAILALAGLLAVSILHGRRLAADRRCPHQDGHEEVLKKLHEMRFEMWQVIGSAALQPQTPQTASPPPDTIADAAPQPESETIVLGEPQAEVGNDKTHETIRKLSGQLGQVQELNGELREQVVRLLGEKAASDSDAGVLIRNIEQTEQFIRELESTNHELSMCIQTLESSNEELFNQAGEYRERLSRCVCGGGEKGES
ncbi:MAG: hypothetical protein AB1640_02935 [bacterium]